MSRYFIGAKPLFVETPLWEGAESHRPDIRVNDHPSADTGLVTAKGETIYRINPPIGFGRDGEW